MVPKHNKNIHSSVWPHGISGSITKLSGRKSEDIVDVHHKVVLGASYRTGGGAEKHLSRGRRITCLLGGEFLEELVNSLLSLPPYKGCTSRCCDFKVPRKSCLKFGWETNKARFLGLKLHFGTNKLSAAFLITQVFFHRLYAMCNSQNVHLIICSATRLALEIC